MFQMVMTFGQIEAARLAAMGLSNRPGEFRMVDNPGGAASRTTTRHRKIIVDETVFNLWDMPMRTKVQILAVLDAVKEALQAGIVTPVEEIAEAITDDEVLAYVKAFNQFATLKASPSARRWVDVMNSVKVQLNTRGYLTPAQLGMVRHHMALRKSYALTPKQRVWLFANELFANDGLEYEFALFEANRRRMAVSSI